MPLTELYIEQTAADRWVGRVEIGGISHHVVQVRANSFAEVMAAAVTAYYEHRPGERPHVPESVKDVSPWQEGTVQAAGYVNRTTAEYEAAEARVRQGIAAGIAAAAKPKHPMSEEHKRKMAAGRERRYRLLREKAGEGPDAA